MSETFTLQERTGHYIGGKLVAPDSGRYFSTVDPSTGESLGLYAQGSAADVNRAVDDAYDGYKAWRRWQPHERGRALLRFSQLMLDHAGDLARLETLDTGKPLRTSHRDIDMGARYFEFYAGTADKFTGDTLPASNEHLVYTVREPYGVTAHILPWNSPINQFCRGAAPALAMGNSIVVKPAEQTPITAIVLAQIAIEAGLPPGAVNVVTGFGEECGGPLALHPRVGRITFTGSVETGRLIMHAAAERIIPVTTELGGKSPFIVFDDADLEKAAAAAVTAFTANCGQTCSAGSRLLVHRSIRNRFVDRMTALIASTVTLGPGLANPTIGPLISGEQLTRVESYMEVGKREGARIACGGRRATAPGLERGFFFEPTILVDATNEMRVAREEIFGPVGCVIAFDSEDEAVAIANDSEYGLIAGVWTKDLSRAVRVSNRIEAGQVYVNNYREVDIHAPFGGYKSSGVGREKGLEALQHYTQVKTVVIRI